MKEKKLKLLKKLLPMYLNYGLEFAPTGEFDFNENQVLTIDNFNELLNDNENWQPLLRPLSDLTKDEFKKKLSFGNIIDDLTWFEGFENKICIGTNNPLGDRRSVYYQDFLVLFECHFDISGLIEEGLAIDINTLKE